MFQQQWNNNKGKSSFFGDAEGEEDEDVYNYEFEDDNNIGSSKLNHSLDESNEFTTASRKQDSRPTPVAAPVMKSSAPAGNALDRAQDMLKKYQGGGSTTQKSNPSLSRNSKQFCEDDISITDSDDDPDISMLSRSKSYSSHVAPRGPSLMLNNRNNTSQQSLDGSDDGDEVLNAGSDVEHISNASLMSHDEDDEEDSGEDDDEDPEESGMHNMSDNFNDSENLEEGDDYSNEEFDEGGGRDEVDDESDDGPARPKIMSFADFESSWAEEIDDKDAVDQSNFEESVPQEYSEVMESTADVSEDYSMAQHSVSVDIPVEQEVEVQPQRPVVQPIPVASVPPFTRVSEPKKLETVGVSSGDDVVKCSNNVDLRTVTSSVKSNHVPAAVKGVKEDHTAPVPKAVPIVDSALPLSAHTPSPVATVPSNITVSPPAMQLPDTGISTAPAVAPAALPAAVAYPTSAPDVATGVLQQHPPPGTLSQPPLQQAPYPYPPPYPPQQPPAGHTQPPQQPYYPPPPPYPYYYPPQHSQPIGGQPQPQQYYPSPQALPPMYGMTNNAFDQNMMNNNLNMMNTMSSMGSMGLGHSVMRSNVFERSRYPQVDQYDINLQASQQSSNDNTQIKMLLEELKEAKRESAHANKKLAAVILKMHHDKEARRSRQFNVNDSANSSFLSPITSQSHTHTDKASKPKAKKSVSIEVGDKYNDRAANSSHAVRKTTEDDEDDDGYFDEYSNDFEDSRGMMNTSSTSSGYDDDVLESPKKVHTVAGAGKWSTRESRYDQSDSPTTVQVPDPLIASSIDISKNMKYYEKERVGEEEGRDGGGDVRHYEHEDGTPAGSPHRHRSRRDPDAASPSHRSYARSSPSRYSSSLNSAGTYPCHIPLNSMYQDSNPLGSSIMSSQIMFRKQLLSLRQRLHIANSSYNVALDRSNQDNMASIDSQDCYSDMRQSAPQSRHSYEYSNGYARSKERERSSGGSYVKGSKGSGNLDYLDDLPSAKLWEIILQNDPSVGEKNAKLLSSKYA